MISIRDATINDAEFLFSLRNEKSNRLMFKNNQEVKWENHLDWLAQKLIENDFYIYIAEKNEEKIGQFRVDQNGEVSVSLSEKFKGKGLGWKVIKLGSELYRQHSTKKLVAEVKISNISSTKAFLRAGFLQKENFFFEDQEYYRLVF